MPLFQLEVRLDMDADELIFVPATDQFVVMTGTVQASFVDLSTLVTRLLNNDKLQVKDWWALSSNPRTLDPEQMNQLQECDLGP